MDLIKMLRDAIEDDPRSLYALAKDAGLEYSVLNRFANGIRTEIGLTTTGKLCEALGYELRKVRRKKVK